MGRLAEAVRHDQLKMLNSSEALEGVSKVPRAETGTDSFLKKLLLGVQQVNQIGVGLIAARSHALVYALPQRQSDAQSGNLGKRN